jgi:hypothetical protein
LLLTGGLSLSPPYGATGNAGKLNFLHDLFIVFDFYAVNFSVILDWKTG